jgi:tetratricopeptide (TPR) repeat protein
MKPARLAAVAFSVSACAGATPPAAPPPAPKVATAACPETNPRALALSNEADAKMAAFEIEVAIGLYEEAARLAPDEPRIAAKLARAYRKKEDWTGAAAALERATARTPGFANLWFERGYALEQLAKKGTLPWAEVRAPFERCVAVDPNFADCHQELGEVLLRLDDETGALKSYTRAVQADPAEARRYAPLAALYLALDRIAEAHTVLEQAKAFSKAGDKGLISIHILSASVHDARGETAAMVSDLEDAMRAADPGSMERNQLLFSLGSAYAMMKPPRSQESLALLKSYNSMVCKSFKAATYRAECEVTATLISRLERGAP